MIWLPTMEQTLRLHHKLIERTGGLHGVRDAGLIESAIMRANASFGGYESYASLEEKAAVICCGLIKNHGFLDGNKRIGIAAMLLIVAQNGTRMQYAQAELVSLGLSVAKGEKDVQPVVEWIADHTDENCED